MTAVRFAGQVIGWWLVGSDGVCRYASKRAVGMGWAR